MKMDKRNCEYYRNIKSSKRKRQGRFLSLTGFTIIEVLAVVSVMLIILGIGVPVYKSLRNRSRIAKAKAAIVMIEIGLERYRSEHNKYPDNSGDLNADVTLNKYLREYKIYFKSDDLKNNRIIDPWGNPYVVYVDNDCDPATGPSDFRHNRSSVYIYSCGPDGSGSSEDDNVDSYMPM